MKQEVIDALRAVTELFEALSDKPCHEAHIAIIEAELENIRKEY